MRVITAIIAILFTALTLNAQMMDNGTQVMLKGEVVDEKTGEPLGVEIEFKDPNGKKFVVKTDGTTGKFDQLLNAGSTYELIFSSNEIYRKQTSYTVPNAAEEGYGEISNTFKVQKMAPGVIVENFKLFEPGTANLTSAGKSSLKSFKLSMRFNRNAEFEFVVNASNQSLAKERLNTLKDFISDWRRSLKRLTYSTGTGDTDLVIKITKVRDMFKR